ncbi:MAG: ATP-binding protein, partial [Bacteroidota bacterium]
LALHRKQEQKVVLFFVVPSRNLLALEFLIDKEMRLKTISWLKRWEKKIASQKRLVEYSGIALVLLALVVILGWYTNNIFLIQLNPAFAAMQYNTALGFLFFGGALSLMNSRFKWFPLILGFLGALVGFLTLDQYLLGVDFKIDELLMEHYIDLESAYPGRMSPNTAICFFLAGLAFLTSSKPWRIPQFSITLALIVVGLGTVSILGYALGLHNTYGWGNLPQMAVHTSIGFILLGLATAIQSLRLARSPSNPMLRPGEFFLLILTAVLVVGFLLKDIQMPLGIVAGLPYVLLLVLSWNMTNPKAALNLSFLTTIMVTVGYCFSPSGAEGYIPLLNRVYTISAIWITGLLLYRIKSDQQKLQEKNTEIKTKHEEVNRATEALQVSNEELAAANEELRVSNEELIQQQLNMRVLNQQLNEKSRLLEQGERFAKLNTWIYDPQNGTTQYSQAYLDVHEFEADEIDMFTATTVSIARIHPGDQERMKEFRNQELVNLPLSAEYRYLLKDGSAKWLRDTIAQVDGDKRILGITQDITAERKAKAKLKLAYGQLYETTEQLQITNEELIGAHQKLSEVNEELEARVLERTRELAKTNSYLDNFVHATAHDLRSPVANLKQISELMQILKKEEDPIIDKLSSSVDRLDRTVTGLIQIIDAQKPDSSIVLPINLHSKAIELLDEIDELVHEKEAELTFDFQVSEIMYLESFYDCIFRNLVQNALKYASADRKPQITVSTYREDQYVVLKVQDNGIGINLAEAGRRI